MAPAESRRVVIAHEADEIRDAALRVARDLGFEAIGVADGLSARALVLAAPAPAALVLDVGLPEVMAYQILDELRARGGEHLPVILIASVYSRTAYKRRPSSLHGADDYVEQHHVPDQLGPKLLRLLGEERRALAAEAAVVGVTTSNGSEAIRRAGEGRLAFRYATRDEAVARARKLAGVVVADLLLYAGDAVDGARNRAELETTLGADLQAARDFLSLRVPAEIFDLEDFVAGALEDVAAARQGQPPGAARGNRS